MKNMMSMAEIDQLMQLEVAVPLAVGIAMLLYTCFFLFTYKEKGAGKAKKSKATPAGKATRRSVRESKAPKVWGEDDDEEPKVSCRGGEFASKLSLS